MNKIIFYLFCILTLQLLSGCGPSQDEYNKLKAENEKLKKEIEELKYGAERLLKEAKFKFEEKKYNESKASAKNLISMHPSSKESYEAKK